MTKSQQQLAILGVLVLVMVGVYVRAFRSGPSQPNEAQGSDPGTQASGSTHRARSVRSDVDRSAMRVAQRERALQLAWRRDPFIRGGTLGSMSGLVLSGILWDATQPLAVVNGQTVRVGQELDGYQITEISHDRVSVTDGTETFQLRIAQ